MAFERQALKVGGGIAIGVVGISLFDAVAGPVDNSVALALVVAGFGLAGMGVFEGIDEAMRRE